MLAGGGELVTLITGAGAPDGLADVVREHLHRRYPDAEVVAYEGGQGRPLLIGVE
jgi:hypothetical protein